MDAFANPPLSYSLPAWQPGGYRDAKLWIDNLSALGFRWVTFTPTYLVYDETPPRLDISRGPSLAELRAAAEYAATEGMSIKLEPHLDFETTLTGGPYDWRARMRISPLGPYAETVLIPLLDLPCAALTLGSELDVSVSEFPDHWAALGKSLRGPGRPSFGHKLNHDSKWKKARPYIEALDWVSFSFYPKIKASGDIAKQIRKHAERMASDVHSFSFGEFGLGCADLTRPWHTDAASFRATGAMETRRQYYLAFLQFLRTAGGLVRDRPSAFWTVAHCDFLGALQWPGAEAFRDDKLRQAVMEYNLEKR